MPLSIAVLICSNVSEVSLSVFPSEFEQICDGLRPHLKEVHFTEFDATSGEFPTHSDGFDGIVISGSPTSTNSTAVWVQALLARVVGFHDAKVPMAGLCFGHQAIATALGGTVGPNPNGWNVGPEKVTWSDQWDFAPAQKTAFNLLALHKEQVRDLPKEAVKIASAPGCDIAAYRIGDRVLGTQHHPEMLREYFSAILDLEAQSAKSKADAKKMLQAKDALNSGSRSLDSSIVMAWIARILQSH